MQQTGCAYFLLNHLGVRSFNLIEHAVKNHFPGKVESHVMPNSTIEVMVQCATGLLPFPVFPQELHWGKFQQ
jgi:hypothetical protein